MKSNNKPVQYTYGDKGDGVTWRNYAGQYHRIDGPAIENEDGSYYYFLNGSRHREDGPACIDKHGSVEYWQNGLIHRIGGPAIIRSAPNIENYYVNGKCVFKEEHDTLFNMMKLKGLI